MPFYNKILAALAFSALFSAPALADGTPGKKVNRGPTPVQAHQPVPPEPGCYLIEDGKAWSCPARPQTVTKRAATPRSYDTHYGHRTQDHQTGPHCHSHGHSHSHHDCGTVTRTYTKRSAPTRTTRTYTRKAAPTVTRRSSTTTRRIAHPTRTVRTASEVTLDMASFSGGVGNGVDGGFYGGGGTVFIGGGQRFSGVLSHGASSFTFRRGHRGGKRRGGGGCGGCMGGMGGGD